MKTKDLQDDLISWYDSHARDLPWRAKPGHKADPYIVWLSEIMLQQTTVITVQPYFLKFINTWPGIKNLAETNLDDVLAAWAGLGYYSRARNLHACAQIIAFDRAGQFPTTLDALLKLPGVGPYTAAAIAAIAFNQPAPVIDGNVERVITRLFDCHIPLEDSKQNIKTWAAELTPTHRPGDYAQAMMDLGATVCRPKNPACSNCPIQSHCAAQKSNTAHELPKKRAKTPKPTRYGHAYLIDDGTGNLLIDKRPPKGLLGAMDGLPTSDWSVDVPDVLPGTKDLGLQIRHTFTHFHLRLNLHSGPKKLADQFPNARFINDLSTLALPTLFLKALEIGIKPILPNKKFGDRDFLDDTSCDSNLV